MYSGDNKYIKHLTFRNFPPPGLTKAEVLGLEGLPGKTFFLVQHSFFDAYSTIQHKGIAQLFRAHVFLSQCSI